MRQTWHDLLFMHWPIPPEQLQPFLPVGMTPETYDGQAWISVVPFHMSDIHPRFVTAVRWLSAFPELNVRTYVILDGTPGVFFFSLEAGNPAAVWLARTFFHLPYFRAQMRTEWVDGWVRYRSQRQTDPDVRFEAEYRPIGTVYDAPSGSLDEWLTARYVLYSSDRRGHLYRAEIDHPRWPLQPAAIKIGCNTMTLRNVPLPDSLPRLQFAKRLDVIVWSLERLR